MRRLCCTGRALRGCATLSIEATGPGRPFCDLLDEMQITYTGITITSGQGVTRGDKPHLVNIGNGRLPWDLAGQLEPAA